MSIEKNLSSLAGDWKGSNRLHMPWLESDPIKDSPATASVREKMNGQFLSIEYTWTFEGKPQEGMIILGCDDKSDAVQAVWTDSWHSKDVLMLCNGKLISDGRVSVKGFYSVPDHPDWGWRTEISTEGERFRYEMWNVTPEGEEQIAVEMDFERA